MPLTAALFCSFLMSRSSAKPPDVWEKPIAPGVVFRMEFDPTVPRTVNALRISPKSPSIQLRAELAGKTINEEGTEKGRTTPTAMLSQFGALAAVNGDFFSYEHGAPVGQMVRAGELITTPVRPRALFAWGAQDLAVAFGTATAYLKIGDDPEFRLDAVNQPIGANGIALYTSAEGIVSPPKSNLTVVMSVPEGSFAPSGTTTGTLEYNLPDAEKCLIPAGKAFLIASGNKVSSISGLHTGDRVSIRFQADGLDWSKFDNEIGGGPFLVRAGQIDVDAVDEGFNRAFTDRNPRTAIGRTADGDVWIVTVDGRQACSLGATLEELAGIMKRLGCIDAINLDGGGSTALNIRGLTVGRPSDGIERSVAAGVLVMDGRTVEKSRDVLSIVFGRAHRDGTIRATLQVRGRTVRNSNVLWSSHGAAWIDQGGTIHPIHGGKRRSQPKPVGKSLNPRWRSKVRSYPTKRK